MAPKTSDAGISARSTGTRTMAHAVLATDWSTTPLGRIDGWSDRLKTAVDICLQSPLPNFIWWGRDLIQIYNDAAIDLLGLRHPHALGQTARDTWADQWPIMGRLVDDVMATGKSIQWDEVWVRPNPMSEAGEACFAFSMGALRANDGNFEGMIITAIENTLEQQAVRSLRERDEFMALVAHELRNPLAPIRMTVGILRAREASDPLLIKCRHVIDRQTTLMTRVLEDLLDISRLSRGKLILQPGRTSFKAVLDAAIETSRPVIDQHGQELVVDSPKFNYLLDADVARLTQVFANLLNNAAKYSPRGKRIEIVVRERENHLVVSVRDQGIGIAPEMLERIFHLFTQSDNARLHSPGGLGIGLSLAKWLVEMHDGTISVSSAGLDQGSEFTVTLPLAPDQPAQSDAWHLANAALPYRKILIADDNVDAADTIALLLETPGCEIRTVYGGDAAVREAERFQPDLVLLDLEMPGIDGYESCRRIRSCPWSAKTVLVALSGWGQSDSRSVLAGFDLHLMKPVDPDNLVHALRDIRPRAT